MRNLQRKNGVRKLTALCLTIALSLSCIALSVFTLIGASADDGLSNVQFNEYYDLGTELTVPNGTITVGGDSFEVQPIVYFPDGTAHVTDKITLNQTGKYTFEYSASKDGKSYSESKSFCVYDYLLINSATKAPLVNKTYTNEFYSPDELGNLPEVEGVSGFSFAICPSEKVVYNKIIDLTSFTSSDTLIKFDATPAKNGVQEAREVYISLTDAYDTTNVVTVRVRAYPVGQESYLYNSSLMATHGDNELRGWGSENLYQGQTTNWGTGLKNGLKGNWDKTIPVEVRFDYQSKVLYAYNAENDSVAKIVDLSADFGDNAWGGFTTGEARLTLWADSYASSNVLDPFNGIILNVAGSDLTDGMKEDGTIGFNKVVKTNAPVVDFAEYGDANGVPNAMVNFPYKLFGYKINSMYGNEKASARVYYGYGSSTEYEVPVKNGYFVPDNQGVYTIVYTAIDKFGNKSDSNVDVYAHGDNDKWLKVTVPGYENYTEGYYGYEFDFVSADEVITEGNFGTVSVSVIAKHVESGETVDITNGEFIPKKQGVWKITYVSNDYVGRLGYFTYRINVVMSDQVVFGKVSGFTPYMIVGASNPIPKLTYIDYNVSEADNVVSTIYIEKDGVKIDDVTDGYYKPEQAGDYLIVYKAVSAKGVECFNKVSFKAVDVGFKSENFNLAKYFYSEDILEFAESENDVSFVIKENGVAEFIRPVNASNFVFSFNIDDKIQTASSILVTLRDTENKGQVVELEFTNFNGYVLLTVNGRNEYKLTNYRYGGGANISVSIKTGILTVGNVSTALRDYADGSEYKGFDSLLCNLSVKAVVDEGAFGNTKIMVDEVCGQKFYNLDGDTVLPKVIVSESLKGKVYAGETVKISKAIVIDVIDPYATATLTVQGPDGKPVKDVDGVLLNSVDINRDYYLKLDVTGTYQLMYSSADSSNSNAKPSGNVFRVASREKPVITVNGGDTKGKVGKTFEIGKATCTSVSKKVELYAFVLGPIGNMKKVNLEENREFTPTVAGDYTVTYVAIDEWGNMSTYKYVVKVS